MRSSSASRCAMPMNEVNCRPTTAPVLSWLCRRAAWSAVSRLLADTPCRTQENCGIYSTDEHVIADLTAAEAIEAQLANMPKSCPDHVGFTRADLALMCARTELASARHPGSTCRTDRRRSWNAPFTLPSFGPRALRRAPTRSSTVLARARSYSLLTERKAANAPALVRVFLVGDHAVQHAPVGDASSAPSDRLG